MEHYSEGGYDDYYHDYWLYLVYLSPIGTLSHCVALRTNF